MKEIDSYLNRLYRRLRPGSRESAELREEMKAHLLETVAELQAQGMPPEQSVRTAIERFGDPVEIGAELPKLLVVSRRRFLALVAVLAGIAAVALVVAGISVSGGATSRVRYSQAEAARQAILAELEVYRDTVDGYTFLFDRISEVAVYYNESTSLSGALNTRYNTEAIDEIGDINRVFRYHNSLLLIIAIIAADTERETPLFVDIARLGVMKLSGSLGVLELARRVRDAASDGELSEIGQEIEAMKRSADFPTFEAALEYNRTLRDRW